jgi:hypothetical protein
VLIVIGVGLVRLDELRGTLATPPDTAVVPDEPLLVTRER